MDEDYVYVTELTIKKKNEYLHIWPIRVITLFISRQLEHMWGKSRKFRVATMKTWKLHLENKTIWKALFLGKWKNAWSNRAECCSSTSRHKYYGNQKDIFIIYCSHSGSCLLAADEWLRDEEKKEREMLFPSSSIVKFYDDGADNEVNYNNVRFSNHFPNFPCNFIFKFSAFRKMFSVTEIVSQK